MHNIVIDQFFEEYTSYRHITLMKSIILGYIETKHQLLITSSRQCLSFTWMKEIIVRNHTISMQVVLKIATAYRILLVLENSEAQCCSFYVNVLYCDVFRSEASK